MGNHDNTFYVSPRKETHHKMLTPSRRQNPVQPVKEIPEEAFCPLDHVKSLPYAVWKVGKGKDNRVADAFFSQGKFWKYPWQLYYVWDAEINPSKALILVEYKAAMDFVNQIRAKFPSQQIPFPVTDRVPGTVISFSGLGEDAIHPQYLGMAGCADDFAILKGTCTMTERVLPETDVKKTLKAKVDESLHCTDKVRSKAKQEAKAGREKAALSQLRAVQHSLGLKEDSPGNQIIDHKPELDVDSQPRYQPISPPILISIDVEAYEAASSMITEVGISTLDTLDVLKIPPGTNATNWRRFVRARHLRIMEYAHLRNSRFVHGCPEHFQFGQSEMVFQHRITSTVASAFKPPYSKEDLDAPFVAPPPFPGAEEGIKRPLVLVGHATASDIQFLRKMGYEINNLSNLIHVVDTATIWSYLIGSPNSTKLGNLCSELEIDPWWLHNAGNDAYYTMACLLAMCVEDAAGTKFGQNKEEQKPVAGQEGGGKVPDMAQGAVTTSSVVGKLAAEVDLMTFSDGD